MKKNIIIAGHGGQGVMITGKLLSYTAMLSGLQTTFYPSYGPEMRGGTANCTVIISNNEIGSPIQSEFDFLVALNQMSFDKFIGNVFQEGYVFYDRTIVKQNKVDNTLSYVGIPALEIANSLKENRVANMIIMGRLIREIDTLKVENATKALRKIMVNQSSHIIKLNTKAIKIGYHFPEDT
jgi:2-oxoglutarate ferredoxin oxidoreductase subunit gamma